MQTQGHRIKMCDVRIFDHPADSGHEAVDPYYGTPPKPHDMTANTLAESGRQVGPVSYGLD